MNIADIVNKLFIEKFIYFLSFRFKKNMGVLQNFMKVLTLKQRLFKIRIFWGNYGQNIDNC